MIATPLVVENFGRRYSVSGPWAVRHLSFSVPTGAVTALVGPNGSGKSTLLRGCIGFERSDEGTVFIDGIDLRRSASTAVRRVGYVPQALALYRGLTVRDHLDMARVARPAFDHDRALRLLAAVGVGPKRLIRELSGGEQAQVALALAVATRAPLLLLDEPLANLDPLARRDFLGALFAQARNDGTTVVLSSHLVKDIEQVSDRILVLARGQLLLDAEVSEVIAQFRVVPADLGEGGEVVGRFTGPRGDQLTLVRSQDGGAAPTLEDVVLGHLAGARDG